ncbi:MAG: HAMP domain-containing sensor histidine kinase [Gemmatimonadota bacterium]
MNAALERRAHLPATAELMERIGWFIRLRWVAVLGVSLFVVAGQKVLPVSIHHTHVLATVALLALYNGLATLYFRRLTASTNLPWRVPPEDDLSGPLLARWLLPRTFRGLGYDPDVVRTVYFVNVQMLLDLVFLAVLIHFTGGIENPLRMFFLFHVIIAAILLSRRATYFYATVALLLLSVVALGEMAGWLPHYTLSAHWRPGGYAEPHLAGIHLFLLGTTLYITAYMGSSIGAQLRQRELDVFLLSRALEEKAGHLEMAYEKVSAAERTKSQYMRKVAHELRGPLGTIQTALSVALQKAPETASTTSVELIRRAWRRSGELAELTRELLALSRARDGKALADSASFNPLEVANRVLEDIRARAEEGGISLRVEMPSEFPEVTADPEGIRDLLSNLLGNAVRYTPRGGSIVFSMREKEGSLEMEVDDTGIGIEKRALDRIFDDFFRSEAARSHAEDGSGLGMAIVKAVVDQHRGTISVESEVGKGTRVRVVIPLRPPTIYPTLP